MGLSIGNVAKRVGISVDTVRFYEKKGLLPLAPRRESGYRDYPEDTVRRLRFIRNAREIGFTLDEIQGLLSLGSDGDSACWEAQKLASEKLSEVREKIRRLRSMEEALVSLVDSCDASDESLCPILDLLDNFHGRP